MAGFPEAAYRAVPGNRGRMIVALLVGLGLGLRWWNAGTARIHDDEVPDAEDAMWALAPLAPRTALSFLRDHPRDHLRLDPRSGALRPWGPPAPHEIARLGHPCALAYVSGLVMAAVAPHGAQQSVIIGRRVKAAFDAATIALL